MKEMLEDLLAKKKKHYKDDYNEMLGDYKREIETIEGYNGRQMLELLQNCDDEGAKEVLIELNIQNKTISISNDGTPFSEKGYRSLFIANLSSKISKRKYIGNKGLGFRSIINWSNEIEIISNGLSLRYSQHNLQDVYEALFSKEDRINIADEEGLKEGVVPMPMLSVPVITEMPTKRTYATTIVISYNQSYLNDIIKQLNNLTSDLLLFLRSIETVKFIGLEDKEDIKCLRENLIFDNDNINKQQHLVLNDRIWTVYSIEEELPKEYSDDKKKERDLYQISIAVEENMSHSSAYLYSFFPTNIKLNQPYVLHATFDLDATRNQINDTVRNRFILEKIVEFTIEVAKHIAKEAVSYDPLKILFHEHRADTLSKFQYYDLIDDAIRSQALFPCVNDTYKTLEEVLFISNQMAELIQEIGGQKLLTCHLIPTLDEAIIKLIRDYNVDDKFSFFQDYEEVINSVATLRLSSTQRAKYIKIVTQNLQSENIVAKKLNLLIDTNGTIIEDGGDIYTPPTNDSTLKVPSFAKIQFIHTELYEAILKQYKSEEYERRGKSRFVYDVLKDYCNIHSYEPTTLAEKIIRTSSEALERSPSLEQKVYCVQEMNQCLYNNFRIQSDRSKLNIENIPCITSTGSIKKISELHLSSQYPRGKDVEILFENVYSGTDYIAAPAILGFSKNEPIANIETFLLWLGVNVFFRFTMKVEKQYYGYAHTLFDHPFLTYTKKFRADVDSYTGYDIEYLDIENKDKIFKLLDIHKIIILAFIDNTFRKQLYNQDKQDSIKLYYRNYSSILNTPSFIKYKLVTNYTIDGFLLDEKFSWINDFEIDYNYSLFHKYGLTKIRVKETLLNLGGVETINELSIKGLNSAFDKFNRKFPDGIGSQQFYKKALGHFDEHKLKLTQKVKLFARTGNNIKLFGQKEIYFSDNNFLPSNLSASYPIFNFPVRAGAKKAIEFFGINDLNDLKVILVNANYNDTSQHEFEIYFNSLKPYLLAYRLEDIEKSEVKDDQVMRLNNLRFKFCNNLVCKVQDDQFSLSQYNYIYNSNDKTYYIKVEHDTNIDLLKQDPLFVDNFSEILLNAFATSSEKQQFESLLRDSKATIDYNITKLLGDNALEEAKILLGLVTSKKVFWNIVFELASKPAAKDESDLERLIAEVLQEDEFSISYEDVGCEKNMSTLCMLFQKLNITVRDFNKLSATKLSTFRYNINQLNNHLSSIENVVKQIVWNHLSNEKSEQKYLLKFFNRIELIKNEYEGLKPSLENDFLIDYASIVKGLLEKQFEFVDLNEFPSLITFFNLYRQNRNQFTDEEIVNIENNPEIHSLLYFDDIQAVKNLLRSPNEYLEPVTGPISTDSPNSMATVRYVSNIKTVAKITELHRSNIYNPLTKTGNHSKVIGNRIEDLAYNKLVEMHGERFVIHKSKETEWEHYDIKYSKDEGKSWIYVEVKSAALNKFTITIWEKMFGEKKSDNYEVWVWKDENFIVLEGFFNLNPILNPTEFEVILEEI